MTPSQFDYTKVTTIVPADNGSQECRGLWVGTAGNVALVDMDGTVATLLNVPNGTLLRIAFHRINSTNTTASNMVGMT